MEYTRSYKTLKEQHQQEINSFPIFFAFNNKQFEEGMVKLGLTPEDTDEIFSIGAGGYILKTDSKALNELTTRHTKEMQDSINNSDQFVFDMFYYELGNHEYTYTGSTYDTLEALGLTIDEVTANPRLLKGFTDAKKAQYDND